MKVAIYGKNAHVLQDQLQHYGIDLSEKNPDVVISYGGDGTLLAAERTYPTIPKLPIRDSLICKKCSEHTTEALLRKLSQNTLILSRYRKLEASFLNTNVLAVNDIVLRNTLPTHAIRFFVAKNSTKIVNEVIIGDGVVASTPFGSTGYFHSISRQTFTDGFALAFNNTTATYNTLYLSEADTIAITIVRGPAQLSYDNAPTIYDLDVDEVVTVKMTNHYAQIYNPEILRCNACEVARDKRLHFT